MDNPPKAHLQVTLSPRPGQVINIRTIPFTLGNSKDCQFFIDDLLVSPHHAEITWDGSRYCLADLQSQTGTFLNDTRLQPQIPLPLKNGDIISLSEGAAFHFYLSRPAVKQSSSQSDQQFSQALAAAERGELDHAVQILENLVGANPRYGLAWLKLAEYLDDPARKEECLRYARRYGAITGLVEKPPIPANTPGESPAENMPEYADATQPVKIQKPLQPAVEPTAGLGPAASSLPAAVEPTIQAAPTAASELDSAIILPEQESTAAEEKVAQTAPVAIHSAGRDKPTPSQIPEESTPAVPLKPPSIASPAQPAVLSSVEPTRQEMTVPWIAAPAEIPIPTTSADVEPARQEATVPPQEPTVPKPGAQLETLATPAVVEPTWQEATLPKPVVPPEFAAGLPTAEPTQHKTTVTEPAIAYEIPVAPAAVEPTRLKATVTRQEPTVPKPTVQPVSPASPSPTAVEPTVPLPETGVTKPVALEPTRLEATVPTPPVSEETEAVMPQGSQPATADDEPIPPDVLAWVDELASPKPAVPVEMPAAVEKTAQTEEFSEDSIPPEMLALIQELSQASREDLPDGRKMGETHPVHVGTSAQTTGGWTPENLAAQPVAAGEKPAIEEKVSPTAPILTAPASMAEPSTSTMLPPPAFPPETTPPPAGIETLNTGEGRSQVAPQSSNRNISLAIIAAVVILGLILCAAGTIGIILFISSNASPSAVNFTPIPPNPLIGTWQTLPDPARYPESMEFRLDGTLIITNQAGSNQKPYNLIDANRVSIAGSVYPFTLVGGTLTLFPNDDWNRTVYTRI